ncbi:hypothetical protein ACM46_20930 [Chryseobacterium angstadtii]|uniref:Uncharacterized protein n=1 Tax=Chryseobacterium angstadtii TaxID=558151 RepID=A0A0J7I0Q6_9FLAO|nr:hypothetical protein [Chryseobacterium angstadtii]KMQ59544.1 hypothetical protein ACM46_20930 [Chryseobacterium angstadtii]
MNVYISLTIDSQGKHKSNLVANISSKMKEFFDSKNYGNDLLNYGIGLNCVNPPKGFEKFSKRQSPKYIFDKTTINKYTGQNHRMYKLFLDDITLTQDEYEKFLSLSDKDSLDIVRNKITDLLENLDKLPKKVKDFDKDRFKLDMKFFLEQFVSNSLG